MGIEITHGCIRCADVGPDDLEQFFVGLTGVKKFGDWNLQTFFKYFVGFGGEDPTTNVWRVTTVGKVGHDFVCLAIASKHWCQDGEVVDLSRRQPRVIGNQHVTGAKRLRRVGVEQVNRTRRHWVDVSRSSSQRLGDHQSAGIENRTGQIKRLPNNRAKRSPNQSGLLFIGDREQSVPKNFELDWS